MLDEKKAQGEVKSLEKELIAMLLILVATMDVEGRRVVLNTRNLRIANLTQLFGRFNKESQVPFLKKTFTNLTKTKGELDDYYKALGLSGFTQSHRQIDLLNKSMSKYMGEFAVSSAVKLDIQGILTGGIASNITQSALAKSIKKEVRGKLQKYYQQFMWDEIVQMERVENNFYAKELELNWFIYKGGLIETSRPFCIKRDGKLFNRSDAKKWRFDPTLPQPETSDTYQPLVELGRWNCRHWLNWITDEQANNVRDI